MESIATWLAPIATTIAALMTASNLGTRITGWGFVVFTVGSLAWRDLTIDNDRLTTHLDQAGFEQLEQLEKDDWW